MLIGLTGYAGSGKDTAANYLVRNYSFTRLAFADKLRELAYAQSKAIRNAVDLFGWEDAKRTILSVREELQEAGQAHRDVFGEDFWVNQVLPKPGTADAVAFAAYRDIVISDVRYPNEVARIRALGGLIICITRDGVGPVNDHQSEQPVLCDYEIENKHESVWSMYQTLDYLIAKGIDIQ